ncbi:MAG: polyprenol monophosphomannose synthase [Terracidiphilus sp.]
MNRAAAATAPLSRRKASGTVGALEQGRTQEKLALAIPTFREAGNIANTLGQVRSALDAAGACYEIIVIDDDSRDGTAEIVTAISRDDPRVRLLVREGERGLSGAILHGWRSTDATLLGAMDADLQHPPALLPVLLAAMLDGRDLVIASRYAQGGKLGEWNPLRRFFSAAAVAVTWPLQRGPLRARDPMSGFFMVRRRSVNHLTFQKTGFKLLLEILVRGRLQSIEEIPFAFGQRGAGQSKASWKVALDYAVLLVRLYRMRYNLGGQLRSATAD